MSASTPVTGEAGATDAAFPAIHQPNPRRYSPIAVGSVSNRVARCSPVIPASAVIRAFPVDSSLRRGDDLMAEPPEKERCHPHFRPSVLPGWNNQSALARPRPSSSARSQPNSGHPVLRRPIRPPEFKIGRRLMTARPLRPRTSDHYAGKWVKQPSRRQSFLARYTGRPPPRCPA